MSYTPVKNISELNEYLEKQERRIVALETENEELKRRVELATDELARLPEIKLGVPQTDLLSFSYLRRAFAVWGHYFVAQLIISLVMLVIYFFVVVIVLGVTSIH